MAFPVALPPAAWDGPRPALSVVLHDVAPATLPRCEAWLEQLHARFGSLPVTLLAVPRWHGEAPTPAFERWLDRCVADGHELALHGYSHLDEGRPKGLVDAWRRQRYTAGEGEFAAIDEADALARLRAGLRWFGRNGWRVDGFVPPAWLLGAGGWAALTTLPFAYTCTLATLVALHGPTPRPCALRAQSIVYSTRSAWRRAVSPWWNRGVALAEARSGWMRFELHPDDVRHASARDSALRLLGEALAAGREPLRLREAVRRLRLR